MTSYGEDFNLLPWRAKKLKIKILSFVSWHGLVIIVCMSLACFGNVWFGRWTLVNQERLTALKVQLKRMQIVETKIFKANVLEKRHLILKQFSEKNVLQKNNINQIIGFISLALAAHTFFLNFSIEGSFFILKGMTQTENELLSFINQLRQKPLIKKVSLKEMKKKINASDIYFEIQATLSDPL